jgi:transketolase
MNGIALHSNFKVFGGTFLVFSDYMRPSIRLAAMMKLPVVYVFTHDSIFVGEDGPTHQPIEHVTALRLIPNLKVVRPADGEETAEAWRLAAEQRDAPTALILTRQGLKVFEKPSGWREGFKRGAYVAKAAKGTPDATLVATGSEVNLALDAALACGKNVQVVSMPCRELFNQQSKAYRDSVIPEGVETVAIEAGVSTGWERIATSADHIVSIDRFGESGPAAEVAEHLGLTVGAIVAALNR